MRCPITGKNCHKHKAFSVEYNSNTHLVCEDCMHSNAEVKPDQQDDHGPCPRCGTALDQVVRTSRLGCATCYDHFDEPLSYIIASVQFGGENKHIGSVPETFKRSRAESTNAVRFATEIAQKIKTATKEERYEEASRLNAILTKVKAIIQAAKEDGELDPESKAELAEVVYQYLYPEST